MNLELGSYSPEAGLQLKWEPGYELHVTANRGEVLVSANEEGLRSLAVALLTLADAGVPAGVHAHLEPGLELEDDSIALVLDKRSL